MNSVCIVYKRCITQHYDKRMIYSLHEKFYATCYQEKLVSTATRVNLGVRG
jgi:hypothetical protein